MSGAFLRSSQQKVLFQKSSILDYYLNQASILPKQPHQLHQSSRTYPRFFRKIRDSTAITDSLSSLFSSSSLSSYFKNGFVGWYMGRIKSHPILTKSVTSAGIYTVSDFSSQGLTEKSWDSYDVLRTLRMAGYGMLFAGPSMHFWFNFMSRRFPKRDVVSTMKKILAGQVAFGPVMTSVFFSLNAGLQGESGADIYARLKRDLLPTLTNGLLYWPVCDFVTFKFVPVQLQIIPAQIRGWRCSCTTKGVSCRIFSQEIPSDITVQAGGASFTLHKFPLISKCGYIKKFVTGATDTEQLVLELAEIPGGEEAFELAAKFCYGINFEINTDNIAMLRCVAEFLEMTEDYAIGNLVSRTEAFLTEVAMTSLAGALSVLHCSESLLPMAEKVKLVNRCVDAIAYIACKESQTCLPDRTENNNQIVQSSNSKPIVDWWAEDLTVLRIDIFQRVIMAMIARGFKQYALGPVLMLYAQKSLRGLEIFGKGRKKIDSKQEHDKRVVLETIVSLLPREKNTMSVSFLAMLLRAAIYLETTVACRLDLEKRMGLQLGQAVLDDLLIPSYSFTGDTLFDVDTVQRIMANYLEYELDGNRVFYNEDDEFHSPPPSDMERVGKLMESYLAEIASDRNLSVSRLISLAELIPEQAKITEDGMYRAIDIYMKAHPAVSDMERKKVCSLMDCQKLSREACAHAAQNDRLPVQTVVQVLYYEQQRLRDAVNGNASGAESPAIPKKTNLYSENNHAAPNELQKLRRENEDLKIELARTRMRLKELEKNIANSSSVGTATASSPVGPTTPSAGKPPLPRKSFIGSVSKKLGRLVRPDMLKPSDAKGRTKPSKDRRHSIS